MSSTESFSYKEVIIEIRDDVKDLKKSVDTKFEAQDVRLRVVEGNGFRLQGVWTTVSVLTAVVAGGAGLVLGALSYF